MTVLVEVAGHEVAWSQREIDGCILLEGIGSAEACSEADEGPSFVVELVGGQHIRRSISIDVGHANGRRAIGGRPDLGGAELSVRASAVDDEAIVAVVVAHDHVEASVAVQVRRGDGGSAVGPAVPGLSKGPIPDSVQRAQAIAADDEQVQVLVSREEPRLEVDGAHGAGPAGLRSEGTRAVSPANRHIVRAPVGDRHVEVTVAVEVSCGDRGRIRSHRIAGWRRQGSVTRFP